MTRPAIRRALAGVLGVSLLMGIGVLPRAEQTEAAWTDAEQATATASAYNVPEPVANADPFCTATGVLNLAPEVKIWWRAPAGATGFTSAQAEFGHILNNGLLEPILSNLLSSVSTSPSGSGYVTTISGTLLANLLGGKKTLGIRFVYPGSLTPAPSPDTRWRSDWLVANAEFKALGIGNTCTMSTLPSYS